MNNEELYDDVEFDIIDETQDDSSPTAIEKAHAAIDSKMLLADQSTKIKIFAGIVIALLAIVAVLLFI